jgi:hypothetical protein
MFKNEAIMRQIQDHIDMGGAVIMAKGKIPIPKELQNKYSLAIVKGNMILATFEEEFDNLPHLFERTEADKFKGRVCP